MILGITGTICSGHNAIGKILIEKGFQRFSLSDYLREEMTKKSIEINRKNMQDFGDELRKEQGNAILAKIVISKIEKGKDYIIESIRNPGEVAEFKKLNNFHLIMVDAPVEARFKRLLERGRDVDEPKTFEEFLEWEKRDLGIAQPAYGQQQKACFALSNKTITNDSTFEELKEKVEKLLEELCRKT
ncbi:MAG: AAA family ATPase [Nanoarchaeota archaeon]